MPRLGDYVATFRGDNSGLTASLKDTRSKLSGFSTQLTDSVSFFGTGPAAGWVAALKTGIDLVKQYGAAVQHHGDQAERIVQNADMFGTSTDQFQAMSLAAKTSGVSLESLEKIYRQTAETVSGAAIGDADTEKKLKRIGLDPDAIGKMQMPEAIEAIGDALRNLKSPIDQIQGSKDLFGKQALDALRLFKSDLNDAAKEAQRIGALVPRETLENLDNTADEFTKVGVAWDGLKKRMLSAPSSPGQWLASKSAGALGQLNMAFDLIASGQTGPGAWAQPPGQPPAGSQVKMPSPAEIANAERKRQADDLADANKKLAATLGMLPGAVKAYEFAAKGATPAVRDFFNAQQKLADSLNLAKAAVSQNPIKQFSMTLDGLQAARAGGGISAGQFNAAIVNQAKSLVDAAGLGQVRMAGATMKGSVEDYRERAQARAEARQGTVEKQVAEAIKELLKQDQQKARIGELIIRGIDKLREDLKKSNAQYVDPI